MGQNKKAVFNWSGGKDSAVALQQILEDNEFEVVSLLTTINEGTQKSSIHSIPLEILEKQAKSIGIPLYTVSLAKGLKTYDEKMSEAVAHFKSKGVVHFAFGDVFLPDVKAYRENKLNPLGIEVVEPLWGQTSDEMMQLFLESGMKAKVVVTQADKLGQEYVGQEIDKDFISSLPKEVDSCGENGEYHTLCYSGGIFKKDVEFSIPEVNKTSYDFKLDSGQTKTFEYWQAKIIDDNVSKVPE